LYRKFRLCAPFRQFFDKRFAYFAPFRAISRHFAPFRVFRAVSRYFPPAYFIPDYFFRDCAIIYAM
jgi:hypothetical protein